MNCPNCGTANTEDAVFCESCGTNLTTTPAPVSTPEPVVSAPKSAPEPVVCRPAEMVIPDQYRPISAWGYVGYWILYSIPLVGFIFWLVHCFSSKNLNRRSYARSFFCAFLMGLIITVILVIVAIILGAVMGVSFAALLESVAYSSPSYYGYY